MKGKPLEGVDVEAVTYDVHRYHGGHWAVYRKEEHPTLKVPMTTLVAVTVYKKGAEAVAAELNAWAQLYGDGCAAVEENEYYAELNRGYAHDRR